MRVAVVREIREGERRVALVPESCAKLASAGFHVAVESGAGDAAFFPDDAFREAGAGIGSDPAELLSGADLVLKVQPKNEFLDSTKIWQRGIQFRKLTKFQKLQLDYFINTWTSGLVKDRRSQKDRRFATQYIHNIAFSANQDRRAMKERRKLAQSH